MSKLKLTKRGKGIILAVIASILLILLIVVLLNIKTPKTYDISKLHNLLINEYQSLYLTEMDHIDVLNEFGFEKAEVEDALYLKSLEIDKDGNDITKEKNFIIIMNTEKYEEYYGIFESHITSNKMYTEDKEVFKLYNNSILKSGENYVYMIVSNNASEIEQLINE